MTPLSKPRPLSDYLQRLNIDPTGFCDGRRLSYDEA
jgi:hypothetical protein